MNEIKKSVDQKSLVEETIETINCICCVIAQDKMVAQQKLEVIEQLIIVNLNLNEMLKTNSLQISMRN